MSVIMESNYAECHFECHCSVLSVIMLRVIKLSVNVLIIIMLCVLVSYLVYSYAEFSCAECHKIAFSQNTLAYFFVSSLRTGKKVLLNC
jgi:hypothetical protein